MIFNGVFEIGAQIYKMHIIFSDKESLKKRISPTTLPLTYEMIHSFFFLQVRPEKALRCNIINVSQCILEINITEIS